MNTTSWRPALAAVAPLGALLLVQQILYPAPSGVVLNGALAGGRVALIALGIALVYRANRIVNFAQGDLGTVPATLGVMVVVAWGWSYWLGLVAGLIAAAVLGFLVETLIIRRFFEAPRLLLTVATIGLAQVLTGLGLLLPRAFGRADFGTRLSQPFDATWQLGGTTFDANDIFTLLVVPACLVAMAVFLKRSKTGLAIVGSAERPDRAFTLGIPVRRLHTVVWVLASMLAFIAMYLRAGAVGLPIGRVLAPTFLVQALGAAAFGRFERFTTIVAAAVGLGIVDQAMTFQPGNRPAYNDAVLFAIVLIALLVTRTGARRRVADDHATGWLATREPRPIPDHLRRLPEVIGAQVALAVAVGAIVLTLPLWLSNSRLNLATVIVIFGIVAASLVLLSGWAGQVSLGHMAFVGIGAVIAGVLTDRHDWDLSLAALLGGAAGAVAAVVVGFPALRRRGLTLAVSTLAFGLFVSSYVLNRSVMGDRLPGRRIARGHLLGIPLESESAMFYASLGVLALALGAVIGIRRSRTGRVLIAMRDNEPAARGYGIDATRTGLASFALSGFLAAVAGALFVQQQRGLSADPFLPQQSLELFTMVVIGGLGSLAGALLGATYVFGLGFFLPSEWRFLATGGGLLLVLLLFPSGLGGVVADVREAALARVERRRGLSSRHDDSSSTEVTSSKSGSRPRGRLRTTSARLARSLPSTRRRTQAPEGSPGERPTLLEARQVDVHYGEVQVLFGVGMDVAEGEIVALLGTNGAGKSTLLRAITGLVEPSAGSITFSGRETTHTAPDEIAALGVAVVPGGQGVFTQLSVAENLRLAAWGRPRGSDHQAETQEALARFPALQARLDEDAGNLSGGQQQMLALAMAFIARPRLLIIDELSLGLAPAVVGDLLEVVRSLRDGGTTVLLVEQSVNVALTVADRAYFLEKGEVRFDGPCQDLLDRPDLLRAVFLHTDEGSDETAEPDARDDVADMPHEADDRGGDRGGATVAVEASAENAGPVLRASDVSVTFGGVSALDGVSFDVSRGEILGFIGPNGAGKTTLFDVISGYLPAAHGSIELTVDGDTIELGRLPVHRRSRHGLGRSFQDGRLFPGLTVAETIAVALEQHVDVRDPVAAALWLPAVVDSEDAVRLRVDEIIELLGLGDHRDAFTRELSTGTRRIVDLACVVAQAPSVILLDEPSSGIAQREAEALGPVLRDVRAELGASLLVIEHDLPLLTSISDRFIALDLGRVVTQGSPAEVVAHPAVVSAYLGTDEATIARSEPTRTG